MFASVTGLHASSLGWLLMCSLHCGLKTICDRMFTFGAEPEAEPEGELVLRTSNLTSLILTLEMSIQIITTHAQSLHMLNFL